MNTEAFWGRINRSGGPRACWPWHGAGVRNGYGHLLFRDENGERSYHTAHRLALSLFLKRPITPGMFVLHACDNPPCCNPAHLFEGTAQTNVDDMISKGRKVVRLGDTCAQAKLTVQKVREIRALNGIVPQFELASRYGVTYQTIQAVVARRLWKWVA